MALSEKIFSTAKCKICCEFNWSWINQGSFGIEGFSGPEGIVDLLGSGDPLFLSNLQFSHVAAFQVDPRAVVRDVKHAWIARV